MKFAVALLGYHRIGGRGHWQSVGDAGVQEAPHVQDFAAQLLLVSHMAFACQTRHLEELKYASNYIRTLILLYIQTQNIFVPFEYTLVSNECKKKKRVWRLC